MRLLPSTTLFRSRKRDSETVIKRNSKNASKLLNMQAARLKKQDKRFETWIRFPIMTENTQTKFDNACKELRSKQDFRVIMDSIRRKNETQDYAIDSMDPHKKLKEKNVFNEMFGTDISKTLQTMTQRQLLISRITNTADVPLKQRLGSETDLNDFKRTSKKRKGSKLR